MHFVESKTRIWRHRVGICRHYFGPSFRNLKPANVLTHASDSEKRRFSWRGFHKISAKLPILHALRHVCGIGGHTRTEKCLWRFSLQMHCKVVDRYRLKVQGSHQRVLFSAARRYWCLTGFFSCFQWFAFMYER